jgi:hypothetical protein
VHLLVGVQTARDAAATCDADRSGLLRKEDAGRQETDSGGHGEMQKLESH